MNRLPNPELAMRKGLREVKAKDVQIVKQHIRNILGVYSRPTIARYLDGKMPLTVPKYNSITAMFRSYGVNDPWGL